jgi:glutaredoxin
MLITLYSRTERCPYCEKAKRLLRTHGFDFKEVVVGRDLNKHEFQILFLKRFGRLVETVPQIIIGATLIGGYEDLVVHLERQGLSELPGEQSTEDLSFEAFDL